MDEIDIDRIDKEVIAAMIDRVNVVGNVGGLGENVKRVKMVQGAPANRYKKNPRMERRAKGKKLTLSNKASRREIKTIFDDSIEESVEENVFQKLLILVDQKIDHLESVAQCVKNQDFDSLNEEGILHNDLDLLFERIFVDCEGLIVKTTVQKVRSEIVNYVDDLIEFISVTKTDLLSELDNNDFDAILTVIEMYTSSLVSLRDLSHRYSLPGNSLNGLSDIFDMIKELIQNIEFENDFNWFLREKDDTTLAGYFASVYDIYVHVEIMLGSFSNDKVFLSIFEDVETSLAKVILMSRHFLSYLFDEDQTFESLYQVLKDLENSLYVLQNTKNSIVHQTKRDPEIIKLQFSSSLRIMTEHIISILSLISTVIAEFKGRYEKSLETRTGWNKANVQMIKPRRESIQLSYSREFFSLHVKSGFAISKDQESDKRVSRFGRKSSINHRPVRVNSVHNTLWQERGNVIFDNDAIVAASLNQLVIMATLESDTRLADYVTNLLLTTFPTFTTPEVVIEKLQERYLVPSNIPNETKLLIQNRVISLLKEWIKIYHPDFNRDILLKITEFLAVVKVDYPTPAKQMKNLLKDLMRQFQIRRQISHKTQSVLITKNQYLEVNDPISFFKNQSPQYIAEQLTMIEYDIFKNISRRELLNKSWSSENQKITSPNVKKLIDRFNEVSLYASSLILWQEKAKSRTKILTKLIKICKVLEKINNFNTLMAIVSGINSATVRRLKNTVSKVDEKSWKTFSELEQLISPTENYSSLRAEIEEREFPKFPYLGFYLTDLTKIEDGNSTLRESLINVRKMELLENSISTALSCQHCGYDMDNDNIPILIQLPYNTETELLRLSLIREPRTVKKKRLSQ